MVEGSKWKKNETSLYLCLSEFRLSNMLVTEDASIWEPCLYMRISLPAPHIPRTHLLTWEIHSDLTLPPHPRPQHSPWQNTPQTPATGVLAWWLTLLVGLLARQLKPGYLWTHRKLTQLCPHQIVRVQTATHLHPLCPAIFFHLFI